MSDSGEIGLRILIIILIVGVIIYSIINIIFYYRAFRGEVTGISSTFAIFMLIFSAVLLIVGIILGVWVLYYLFRRSGDDVDQVELEDFADTISGKVYSSSNIPGRNYTSNIPSPKTSNVKCQCGSPSSPAFGTGDLASST